MDKKWTKIPSQKINKLGSVKVASSPMDDDGNFLPLALRL
jgi:hypothetical protein